MSDIYMPTVKVSTTPVEKVSGDSSDNVFRVTFTIHPLNRITCDKTYDEILSAYNSGKLIFGILDFTIGGNIVLGYSSGFENIPESGDLGIDIFAFRFIGVTETTLSYSTISIDENNEISKTDYSYQLTPIS